jgi:phosphoglycolate phosphatase
LFDFDGTLVDTMPGLVTAVNAWRQEFGRSVAPEADIRAWVGHGVDDLLGRAADGAEVSAAARARFLDIYRGAPLLTARPFAGIERLLDALADQNVPLAIVTNKPRMATLALLEALDWTARFAAVVCPEDAGTRKPDPAMLAHAMERLPPPGDGWIMIGDSEVDMQAGVQANLPAIGVTWGYREPSVLLAAGARRLVDQPAQLLEPA